MDTPLLTTKLYIPPPRPHGVLRPRLMQRLNAGLAGKVSLISAPAGFGKTTLISTWLSKCERPAAWVSLEDADNDLIRFLTYLAAALQTISPKFGTGVLSALQAAQPIEAVLTVFLNEITAIPTPFILVLDDYHVIDTRAIDDALTFLLEHLPPHGHVVIATREDPQLPLARLRVRNQLSELRVTDLRFTPGEAAEFLTQAMGLSLSAGDIERLGTRTEGWIAGLHLAALALQAHRPSDTAQFIRAFTGSHRFVLDYLVEEVLQQQTEERQQFLLYTSVLDRLYGPLCDAVLLRPTGTGQHTLHALEHANLFLIPLDDERNWYRYHHLFAEVLHTRLVKTHPNQAAELHRRASAWYEQHGLLPDAIRHALIAEDFERAAALVERVWPTIRRSRQEAAFLRWIQALPDNLFRLRPVLSTVYAWALLDAGKLDAAESRLQDAERLLNAPSSDLIVIDEAQFRSLPASIANARAYRAQAVNDVPATITYARLALDLLPEDDDYERGTTSALLGLAYWATGALEAAYHAFSEGLTHLQRGGGILIRIGGTVILAHIKVGQGRLYEAAKLYEQALVLGLSNGDTPLKGTAELYLGLSDIYRQQGDLTAARQFFSTGETLRDAASLPGYDHLWCSVDAQLRQAEGDWETVFELLQEAERRYYRSPIPNVRPISALKTRLLLVAGRLSEALAWVREHNLSAEDDLNYLREYEHLTFVRVLLAQYRHEGETQMLYDAIRLLTRLLHAAETQGRTGSMAEILMLQALAFDAQGDFAAARPPFARALALTEREHDVRLFVDEGLPVMPLLQDAAAHGLFPDYTRRLFSAFARVDIREHAPTRPPLAPNALIEPLSERELDLLRLLKTELSGPEIARELGVALSTVRTHTKSIYGKLAVGNRRAAVHRAETLGLL